MNYQTKWAENRYSARQCRLAVVHALKNMANGNKHAEARAIADYRSTHKARVGTDDDLHTYAVA